MLQTSPAYSGFSVNDLDAAQAFYKQRLGLKTTLGPMGLRLHLAGGRDVFVYAKDDHQPATYTMLNFPVADIDAAVAELKTKGVAFEHYAGLTDVHDIARGLAADRGPDIAWFKDPAGNILAVLQEA